MKKNARNKTERSDRNRKITYAAVAITAVLVLAGVLVYTFSNQPNQPKAAIIDELSSSVLTPTSRDENDTFVNTAKALLYERFSQVDYYSDNATVDAYKNLPSAGYKLIIWRAHSALDLNSKFIAISASEIAGAKDYSQYGDELTGVNITGDPQIYIAITPKFVSEAMSGRFENTVIILMSCNGLEYNSTAEAFIKKGVKAFVSWDGWIAPGDNDAGTARFLDYLINENYTISSAVEKIPIYNSTTEGSSRLRYYPDTQDAASCRIPDYRQKDVATDAQLAAISILKKSKPEQSSIRVFRNESDCTGLLTA
jgi:hypothetical protein